MLQLRAAEWVAAPAAPRAPGRSGLPKWLKAGVERLSGLAMDDVRVHRDSPEPVKLGALAYTKGSDIHLGPGQERHLPHEAWHAVQQKQGRVPATRRMKSVAVNEDAGLEAEADRMGKAASRSGPATTARLALHAPGGQAIQARVNDGGAWLKDSDKFSPTLRRFIAEGTDYMLRGDFHLRLGVEPVHLLDMSKKYLMGETHEPAADAKFAFETMHWPTVGKMFEANKALPSRDRDDLGLPGDADIQNQTLEDLHAFTLLAVLEVMSSINKLRGAEVGASWKNPKHKASIAGHFETAKLDLLQIGALRKVYNEPPNSFITRYQNKRITSKRSREIYYFAVRFQDVWRKESEMLATHVKDGADAVELFDRKDAAKAATSAAQFRDARKGMRDARRFLPDMARALIKINEIADPKERKSVVRTLRAAERGRVINTVTADPARERGMAENINRAIAPLFVNVGDAHLESLSAMVPLARLIHKTESLEKETKKP